MLPTIAIVGRPNVGKSTLFNKLTRSRDALVCNVPGLTRDRQYGTIKIGGQEAILIDTGGIGETETKIEKLMANQTELAVNEAQIILFMVDAKSGLLGTDEILANKLRKSNKPIFIVINKIDGKDTDTAEADFFSLGFEKYFSISAEHNIGITELLLSIENKFPKPATEENLETDKDTIKITFVGRPNVGKSTLVNRILGENRVIAHNQPGTTRDSIFIDFSHRDKNYTLVDTAGVRRRSKIYEKIEKFSIVKTLQAVEATDVVVLLLDATENITDQDLKLLSFVLEEGKALIIAVNKWDNLETAQREKIKSELERRLAFIDFVKIHFVSALHGTGVGNLFKSINRAYSSAHRELKTAELNKILEMAVNNYQPPMVNGRDVKLRYTHIGRYAPPTIIIHGVRVSSLPKSYKKYLEHFFREVLDLYGTPIKLVFKQEVK